MSPNPKPLSFPAGGRALMGLAALLLLAVLIRLIHLDGTSLWIDEIYTLVVGNGHTEATDIQIGIHTAAYYYHRLIAWQPLHFNALLQLLKHNVHLPLYYLLLNPWLGHVAGWGANPEVTALRSFSALCSVLAIPALYLLGRALAGPRAGMLAALAVAVSPVQIYYAQEGRMYALALFWAAWSSLALWKTLYGHRPLPWSLLYALSALGGAMTHYIFAFFLCFHAAFGLVFLWRERSPRFWLLGIGVAAVLTAAAWWLPVYQIQQQGVQEEYHFAKGFVEWYRYPEMFVWQPLVALAGDNNLTRLFYMPMAVIFFGLGLPGFVRQKNLPQLRTGGFLLMWIFVPLLVQLGYDLAKATHTLVIDRYVMLISPGMLLWLGLSLSKLEEGLVTGTQKQAFALMLGAMGVLGFLVVLPGSPFRDEHNHKPIHRKIEYFLAHAAPNSLIFANGPYGAPGLAAYYLVKAGRGDQPMTYWINRQDGRELPLPPAGAIRRFDATWLFRYRANNERGLQTAKDYLESLYPYQVQVADWFVYSETPFANPDKAGLHKH